jgi:hypothetical protein
MKKLTSITLLSALEKPTPLVLEVVKREMYYKKIKFC